MKLSNLIRIVPVFLFINLIQPGYLSGREIKKNFQVPVKYFIENKGQIIDQNNRQNQEVLYLLNTPGMNVQLRRAGFSYDLYSATSYKLQAASYGPQAANKNLKPEACDLQREAGSIQFHRIDFDLIGANSDCEIIAHNPSPGYLNYYTTGTPEKGATSIHNYSSVSYKNLYRNIDLEMTYDPGQGFKYTFIIRPGGNPDAIRMKISGAPDIRQVHDVLMIRTSVVDVEESIPLTFYILNGIRTEIKSSFRKINENLYGITFNQTIPINATLTVDPVPNRLWGTYFGGYPYLSWTSNDETSSVTIDKEGDIVIAGYTSAINNIATAGAYQPVLNGQFDDAYLAKFTPGGVQIWGTYFGGEKGESGLGCITDTINNIFLVGSTMSPTNIATTGTFQPDYDTLEDAFLAKFTPDGFRIWGTYYGGHGREEGKSIALDPQCNIFISGWTNSMNNMVSPGAYQTSYGGGSDDAFLAKLDSSGHRIWGTYYGGPDLEQGNHCSVDNNGHVLLCGYTKSLTNIASPGAHQTIYGGGEDDAFLVLFNENGQRQWGTYYGGTGGDPTYWCYTTNTSGIYLFGRTYSPDNIATPFSYQLVLAGAVDVFIAKFSLNGVREWGTYFGGALNEWVYGADYDPRGALFICGIAQSSLNFATPNAFQTIYGGFWDAYLAKFDTNGFRIWCTYYGGPKDDRGFACRVDTNDRQYIVGVTASDTCCIATPGTHQYIYGGGLWDGFLAKLTDCTNPVPGPINGPSDICLDTTGIIYSIPAIPKVTNYTWTVPPGAIITGGQNTHSITVDFSSSVLPGDITVCATNHCGTGDTAILTIAPDPRPVPVISGSDSLCLGVSGTFTTQTGMTNYLWSLSPGGTIVSGGTVLDSIISIAWSTPGMHWIKLNYNDTNGCTALTAAQFNVFVYPGTSLTTNPLSKWICSGDSTQIILTGSQPGTTFSWTATCSSIFVSGYSNGSGFFINQQLINSGSNPDTVIYSITPDYFGCLGLTADYFVTVNPLLPVSIAVSPSANPECEGIVVTFTATPVNGGNLPIYQWKVNGNSVGTNLSTYTYVPGNGDTITCTLNSNAACVINNPATSPPVLMTVNPNLPVSISITASSNPFCLGSPVTFTATPINGGISPSYQWKVNSIIVGSGTAVYTYIPAAGDVVTCMLTSSLNCVSGNPATSNAITMIVNTGFPAGVTITASANPFCPATTVTFTATPVNGGSNPSYQWKVNGINVGINSSIYSYNPAIGDSVRCVMTSNLACVTSNPATSADIIMIGNPVPVVTFSKCTDTITTTTAQPFKLKGGIPLNGTYSGPGVNPATGIWNPAAAGVGNKTITYSYTNAVLCSASASRVFRVIAAPAFICGNTLTDVRDNQTYQTVQIGTKCWLAENLSYGTEIQDNLVQRDNCIPEKYSRPTSYVPRPTYYQWDELMQYADTPAQQGLCPPAWHVPTETEWTQLFAFFNGPGFAGSPLLSTGFPGFNAVVNGSRFENSSWNFNGFAIHFWTSSSWGPLKAWAHAMNNMPDDHSVSTYPAVRSDAFSVRCIKD